MTMPAHLLHAFIALLACVSFAQAAAGESTRVALVIGNAAYPGAGALRNPANDATDMAAKLRKLGFDVMVRTDIRQKDMLRALTEFGDKVRSGSEALFFYAGHGMQVRGRNYLIPIDADIRNEASVSSEAVDVDQLLDKLAPARLSLVILDACRNNPFEQRFRGGGQGLAQINAPTGTLIAYATAPGKVAQDGDGRNGLYTSELLAAMDVPGIKVEDVFKRVRGNVVRKSNDAQTPWESSSLTGDFYFIFEGPASVQVAPTGVAAASVHVQSADEIEQETWNGIKNERQPLGFEEYLKQYPNGRFAAQARISIAKLKEGETAVSPGSAASQESSKARLTQVQGTKGNVLDETSLAELVPKVTTIDEAKTRLGAPSSESSLSNGWTVVRWHFADKAGSGSARGYASVLFGKDGRMVRIMHKVLRENR